MRNVDASEVVIRTLSPGDDLVSALPDLLRADFESEFAYDVEARETAAGFAWTLIRRPLRETLRSTEILRPFQPWLQNPRGYVAMMRGEPVGYAETTLEQHRNLVRVWNLVVKREQRRRGIGTRLLATVEQAARHFRSRGVFIEALSCNDPGIQFLRKQGYEFWGLNTSARTNQDVQNRAVVLWLGKKLNS